jgi:alkanesulfonate monooxygenase SsuD/methylene tetrahydromethanopterin reductase-like flavin-dependent oxidoreductase (luciferase family)
MHDRVGYFPCQQDPPSAQHIDRLWKEVIVEAGVAEEAGFDSCLFSEHHQQADGYLPNPLMLAGLVGAATRRIRVGTCVLLLPLYSPRTIRTSRACGPKGNGRSSAP